MAEQMSVEQSSRARGGVRRGRPYNPATMCALNVRVSRTTHEYLRGTAGATPDDTGTRSLTIGELLDRLVWREIRRQARKAA